MALLRILHYPDPRLRNVATPVNTFDRKLARLVDDMLETMYDAPGIGLAATQVDVHRRIVVIDISEDRSAPVVLINPRIVESRGEEESEEGCLSVPGIYENVTRADWIKASYQDVGGEHLELATDGLLAVCVQHEIDHLEGHLFVDHLSALKRQRIRKKAEKQARQAI